MPVDELVSELLVVQKTIAPLECRTRGYGLFGISRWKITKLQFLYVVGLFPRRSTEFSLAAVKQSLGD